VVDAHTIFRYYELIIYACKSASEPGFDAGEWRLRTGGIFSRELLTSNLQKRRLGNPKYLP
jgi:hypothetical protein